MPLVRFRTTNILSLSINTFFSRNTGKSVSGSAIKKLSSENLYNLLTLHYYWVALLQAAYFAEVTLSRHCKGLSKAVEEKILKDIAYA